MGKKTPSLALFLILVFKTGPFKTAMKKLLSILFALTLSSCLKGQRLSHGASAEAGPNGSEKSQFVFFDQEQRGFLSTFCYKIGIIKEKQIYVIDQATGQTLAKVLSGSVVELKSGARVSMETVINKQNQRQMVLTGYPIHVSPNGLFPQPGCNYESVNCSGPCLIDTDVDVAYFGFSPLKNQIFFDLKIGPYIGSPVLKKVYALKSAKGGKRKTIQSQSYVNLWQEEVVCSPITYDQPHLVYEGEDVTGKVFVPDMGSIALDYREGF